ncbi:hypothetical protein A1342_22085 [Methylomonas methanica]|uniref:Uncharacterized protein n=1 Tax=Methylomonas denitrificans TaxID=1538553 RepID=A0A126T498_9GAMM|nr:hypothetical protein JT25_010330 [Methylomonas denitrificans]OAI01504.1 hypothetical protein A1342_22085 [Methylomonas methanica]
MVMAVTAIATVIQRPLYRYPYRCFAAGGDTGAIEVMAAMVVTGISVTMGIVKMMQRLSGNLTCDSMSHSLH